MELAPLWISLKVALSASIVVLTVGTLAAWRLAIWHGRSKAMVETVLMLPLVLPPTALGYYLLLILGRGTALGSWLNQSVGLHLILTWQGAAISSAVMAMPLLVRTASAAMENVDVELREAARTIGAGEWTVFWYVLLPLSHRGILAGVALAFARALGEFGATLMVAGNIPGDTQTLPLALYTAVQAGRDRLALEYAIILTTVAFVVLLGVSICQRWVSKAQTVR